MNNSMRCLFVLGMGVATALTSAVRAGDLNPPAGAIQPTDRVTLNAQSITLPYTITQPGSYVLTSNFTGVGGADGFITDADNVTLDLNGFTLLGVNGAGFGIRSLGPQVNITVRNGNVRSWGTEGVGLSGVSRAMIENVRCEGSTGGGMSVGTDSIVDSCISMGHMGGVGIFAGDGSIVSNCVALSNSARGIDVGSTSAVVNCTTRLNGAAGVEAGPGSSVSRCVSSQNAQGFTVFSSTISGCLAEANVAQGISAGSESIVLNCISRQNRTDGIVVLDFCHVEGNLCKGNGVGGAGVGIRATQAANRIDGNTVLDNQDDGIFVVAGNLVIRNTASANGGTNFAIPLTSGPIIPAGLIVSEHPWANIEY